jgi:hypothetical protein
MSFLSLSQLTEQSHCLIRMKGGNRRTLQNLANNLNLGEHGNVSSLSACFPVPYSDPKIVADFVSSQLYQNKYFYDLTPNLSHQDGYDPFADDLILRGTPMLEGPNLVSLVEILPFRTKAQKRFSIAIPSPIQTDAPYPEIFCAPSSPKQQSLISYLQTTRALSPYFEDLLNNWKTLQHTLEFGAYSKQDFPEISNHLTSFCDHYSPEDSK